jgi:hypothetical protein
MNMLRQYFRKMKLNIHIRFRPLVIATCPALTHLHHYRCPNGLSPLGRHGHGPFKHGPRTTRHGLPVSVPGTARPS